MDDQEARVSGRLQYLEAAPENPFFLGFHALMGWFVIAGSSESSPRERRVENETVVLRHCSALCGAADHRNRAERAGDYQKTP